MCELHYEKGQQYWKEGLTQAGQRHDAILSVEQNRVGIDNMPQKLYYIDSMPYRLVYLEEFATWLEAQERGLRLRTIANLGLLKERGPLLARPYVDTLKGSQLANLKELRFQFDKAPIRILFAFDQKQQAVIILAGSKQSDKRWYDTNIPIAEKLFAEHLESERKADEERARKEAKK